MSLTDMTPQQAGEFAQRAYDTLSHELGLTNCTWAAICRAITEAPDDVRERLDDHMVAFANTKAKEDHTVFDCNVERRKQPRQI